MKRAKLLLALALSGITPAYAGIYTDDLTRCLVEKTSEADRAALVQWIFVAMAQHPSVAAMTKISAEDVERHNKVAGELFTRLVTETCNEATRNALKYEGSTALAMSFQVLGQAAGRELFANPDVARIMSGLNKYMDQEKIEQLIK